MMFGADVSKQEKEETEILGSSHSHEKTATERISRLDPRLEAVSRLL